MEIVNSGEITASIQASANLVTAFIDPVNFTANVTGDYKDLTWNFGDGTIITGQLNPTHVYTSPGIYTVTFIASNGGCMATQKLVIRVKPNNVGMEDIEGASAILFPNPVMNGNASLKITLEAAEKELDVFVLDASGKLARTLSYSNVSGSMTLPVDLSGLSSGIYQLIIRGSVFSSTQKITITR
jgi:hypothetical protein